MASFIDDIKIDQEWLLVSFATLNGKRVKGETFGLKIHGTYQTEDEIENALKKLHEEGEVYFDIFTFKVGQWLKVPDSTSKDIKYKYMDDSSKDISLEKMINAMEESNSRKEFKDTEDKTKIHKGTYLIEPETQIEMESLTIANLNKILENHSSIVMSNQGLSIVKNKIENEDYEAEYEPRVFVDVEKDYAAALSSDKKGNVVFTFLDEESTTQRCSSFCFKVSGIYFDDKDFKERVEAVRKEQSFFDVYKIPAGTWIPFNSSDNDQEKLYKELNCILKYAVDDFNNKNKEFEDRIKNKKIEEVKFTKKELEKQADDLMERIKTDQKKLDYFVETGTINYHRLKNKFPVINEEILKIIDELPLDIVNKLEN